MRLARVLFMVGFVGLCAIAARADVTDPIINLHDPDPAACPMGDYCVNLDFTNSNPFPIFLAELFPVVPASGVPDQLLPSPPGPQYSCDGSGGFFLFFPDLDNFQGGPPPTSATFLGCVFLGVLPPGLSTFTISANGPVSLDLGAGFSCQADQSCVGDEVELAPEPGTGLLFMTGLLLLSLAGLARKRFGANLVP